MQRLKLSARKIGDHEFETRSGIYVSEKQNISSLLTRFTIVGYLPDREVASSASDRQGLNFNSCVWRAVSSHSSHHPKEVFPS